MLRVSLADFSVDVDVDGISHVKTSLFLGKVKVVSQLSGSISPILHSLDVVAEHSAVSVSRSFEISSFNHLFAVIPSAASVRGREGDLDSRDDDTSK